MDPLLGALPGTLPGTLFRHLSAVLSPFLLSFGSTAFAPRSMSLCHVECLFGRPVKVGSSCRLVGTVKGFWSKGSGSIVNRGSVLLGRSKCLGLIN